MSKLDNIRTALDKLESDYKRFTFPAFLSRLRGIYSISRITVSSETTIAYQRIFYLECGGYRYRVLLEELNILADYYGVKKEILYELEEKFVGTGQPNNNTMTKKH